MSNEFDKEVAAKIADRAIAEAKKESEEKYGKSLMEESTATTNKTVEEQMKEIRHPKDIFDEFRSFGELKNCTFGFDLPNKEFEGMSKIDFYRQKVQQYEAVENLIQSIECELEDVTAAKSSIDSHFNIEIYDSYDSMEAVYKKCLQYLRQLLEDI